MYIKLLVYNLKNEYYICLIFFKNILLFNWYNKYFFQNFIYYFRKYQYKKGRFIF